MHVEMPKKGALASMKSFAGEYTMIVVSILTALALEHGAQTWHRSHQAHAAQASIETEIRTNLEELRSAMGKNKVELEKLNELRKVLRQDIRDKVDGKQLTRDLMAKSEDGVGINTTTPTLRHEAWDVAVASQAASWMEPALQQRYAGVYALQRDVSQSTTTTMQMMLDVPSLFSRSADLEFGKVDGTGLYYSVIQLQVALAGTQRALAELEKELQRALPKT